jgi:hypothetical protein
MPSDFKESSMPKDWQETGETRHVTDAHDSGTGLSSEGIRTMQGVEPTTPLNDGDIAGDGTEAGALSLDESDQVTLEELKKPYDESQLEYRLGSPHADYQMHKGVQRAERRHELDQRAATGDSLADAIDTTLAAHKEARSSDETPMDQYFREKHGAEPYTEAAYPQDEDE